MKKSAEKNKSIAPAKKTGQGKRISVKKSSSMISETAKKDVGKKPAGKPTRSVKKTKKAAKPSPKLAEKITKPSHMKKTGKGPSETAGKASSSAVKIASRGSARKKAPAKTAAKRVSKKPSKIPAGSFSPTTKIPAKETKSMKTKKKASLPRAFAVPKAGPRELPGEYGENEVILMSVDPHVIFVDWEIKKEQVPDGGTPIIMRVFDVTSGERSWEFHRDRFFDMLLDGRIGSGFFEIGMPGREVAIEIGLWQGEKFSAVLKSEKVSMPELVVPDELGIAQKLFDSGVPSGY